MSEISSKQRSATDRGTYGGKQRRWWALAATCFGLFMALLDVTVVNVALPVIQRDLDASFSDLQWVISAYTVALAAFLVTAGGLGNGLVNPPISTVAVSTVSRGRAGMASGVNNVCRQVGMAFGIAFLGALLTNRYDEYVHGRIQALNAPRLTDEIRSRIIDGVQQAGTIAGSKGLAGGPSNPFQDTPLYPAIQQIARTSFVDGTTFILYVAAIMLALGALAALVLIRKSDMVDEPQEARPEADARMGKDNDRSSLSARDR